MTHPTSEQKRSTDPAAIRGVLVLVVAAVIGIVLLANSGTGGIETSNQSTDEAGVTTVPAAQPTTTTVAATPVTRPPAEVSVLVLNATGGKQAFAGRDNRQKLQPLGFKTLDSLDISARPTVIYFKEGYEQDAKAVASALALPETAVAAYPSDVELPQVAKVASIVVVIGSDQPADAGGGSGGTKGGSGTNGTTGG